MKARNEILVEEKKPPERDFSLLAQSFGEFMTATTVLRVLF